MTGSTFGDKSSWPIGDWFLTHLTDCLAALNRAGYKDVHLCAPDYFSQLKVRRLAMMEFGAQVNPEVIFVGNIHTERVTQGDHTRANQSNDLSWEIIKEHRKRAIFLVESDNLSWGDGQITESACIAAIVQKERKKRPGFPVEVAQQTLKESRDLLPRLVRVNALVFAGEEWPLTANYQLLHPEDGRSPAKIDLPFMLDLCKRFVMLRSELIVVRTLERQQKTARKLACMIQGNGHRDDMPELARLYNFRLTLRSAVP